MILDGKIKDNVNLTNALCFFVNQKQLLSKAFSSQPWSLISLCVYDYPRKMKCRIVCDGIILVTLYIYLFFTFLFIHILLDKY